MTIVLDHLPDDNIIKNMLDKLENIFAKCHDSLTLSDGKMSKEMTQALIEFIQYRDEFLDVTLKLDAMGAITTKTGWMMEHYCYYITDCLQVYNNDFYHFDKEQIHKLKEWRDDLDDE